jgi:uncharacterized protein DUF2846
MRKNLLMLFASAVALAAVPAFAQNASPKMLASVPQAVAPGCGAKSVKFEVKTEKGQHPFPDPATGKALVYFIEDDSQYHASPKPTMRAGVDGQWMGATHGSSYFYFEVTPGGHHLCTNWGILGRTAYPSALRFTAEAGKSYFFRVQNTWIYPKDANTAIDKSEFKPIEPDQGEVLASQFKFAISHVRR